MKVKEESAKVGLKLNIQKTKIMASCPITSWKQMSKQWKQWLTLFFWAPKSLQMVTATMKLKDTYSLEGSYDQSRQHIKKQRRIKKNSFELVLMRWMKLEPIIQSEVSQEDKDHYSILTHIYGIQKDGNDNPIYKTEKETQMYRTDFWTLLEKTRVGCFKRTALKHVYYLG